MLAKKLTGARALWPKAKDRTAIRPGRTEPLFDELKAWLDAQLPKISIKSELAKAIHFALTRKKKMHPHSSTAAFWN